MVSRNFDLTFQVRNPFPETTDTSPAREQAKALLRVTATSRPDAQGIER